MSVVHREMPDGTIQWGENDYQTHRAKMAYAFADHMILAVTQGHGIGMAMHEETKQPHEAGKTHTPLMSIPDIVKRACDLSEALWVEMVRREFIVEIDHGPDWKKD